MLNSQDDQGGPSRSSGGSVTPSRRPHRLPDNLNRELEMRKLGPGYTWLTKRNISFLARFDWSQMIVIRRQNKSGKSSAESEGSPDEVLIFGLMRYLLIPFQQLDIWPLLKVGGSGRKKPGVLTDNLQRQRFELILFSSSLIYNIWFIWSDPLQVSLQLRRGKGKEADGKYQEGTSEEVERFRKQERLPFLSTMHVDL